MENIGLSLVETLILVSLATVVSCFFAAVGGLVRYATRASGSMVSVHWLIRLGIFTGIPFGIIGLTSGYLTGLSRVGAVSALVPAGLTLVGGVGAFLFGKGGRTAVVAAFAIINFASMTMIGTLIGGRERVETEQAESSLQYKLDKVKEEFLIQRYRRSLGLENLLPKSGIKDNNKMDDADDEAKADSK
jgi:hypothetical protein